MQQTVIALLSLLIPLIAMPLGGLVVYLTLRQAREERGFLHRERMAAIEKGLDVRLFGVRDPRRRASPLRSAMVVLASGLALSVPVRDSGPGAWMWGFWLALVGVAMLAHWFAGGKREWERDRSLDEELTRAYADRLRAPAVKTAEGQGAG